MKLKVISLSVVVVALALLLLFPSLVSNNALSPVQKDPFKIENLYDSMVNPWGMTWLPDGRLLVTDRSGEILVFKNDKFTGQKLTGVPKVYNNEQGGLLDIQIHPNFTKNHLIYLSYSKPVGNEATTAIARFTVEGNKLTNPQDIFVAQPTQSTAHHFGSRIIFDKSGFLYFSVGERGNKDNAQTLENDLGKIHRLYDDGRVPTDNPFVGQKGARPSIWSYGHRNPQGLVYDAVNNRIWESEHGPKGGDELNLIQKGKNYGWPKTSYGINYDGTILTENKELPGIQKPVHYWVPSIGTCGITIVKGKRYSDWKDNILVGGLALQYLSRVQLSGTTFVKEEKLLQGKGRVRCVAESPDGYLYVLTEGPAMLMKLVPTP